MLRPDRLLRTKLAPPRLHRRVLTRPALMARLRESLDYRLTLVHAGTGYGKTTALASLCGDETLRCIWYTLDESDRDPQQFLAYLIAACRLQWPELSEAPLAALQELSSEGAPQAWSYVMDTLTNALVAAAREPTMLVLDDYHFVSPSPEVNALVERCMTWLPADLHVILASRQPFDFPSLVAWRAKGEVLEIERRDLVFAPSEIEQLFHTAYGMQLAPDEVQALADKTEGWPIALQLVWQGLRDRNESIKQLLAPAHVPTSLSALFDYLARDVLDRQLPDVAEFLRATAVLRELTPEACDAVTQSNESEAMLERLHTLDLFLVALGSGHYRYHHLFHDFLNSQFASQPAHSQQLHRRAAQFFHDRSNLDEAIYHWLSASAFEQAAADIEIAGEVCLRDGRLDALATWIDALPPDVLAEHPRLQTLLGDVCRLRSRFDESLAWYRQAEQTCRARDDAAGISRVLHGQALVYLDTVRPAQAENVLQQAVRIVDRTASREARAQLLELLAENKLNMGKPDEAEALRVEAQALRADARSEDTLSVRVKLRTGQLDDAQRILEVWAESERDQAEQGQVHSPRAHRETVLILSLIHSLRGQAERAFALAQEGITLGQLLNSPFVTAVGHMRLGHAWQLIPHPLPPLMGEGRGEGKGQAIRCYQSAIALGDQLAVRRTRAEAMWGLTRAYGFLGDGDLKSAQRSATEGVEIARWAGDPWMQSLIELTLGASHVLAGRTQDAVEMLLQVLVAFRECGDSFGRAATRLWQALAYLDLRQNERLTACLEDLLGLAETHGYDFLFTAPTLLGPPDPRRIVPLLIAARDRRIRPAYANHLLAEIGLPDIKIHPGYQLRVQTLGAFRAWRGHVEIEPREWQRDKARQLFQLFIAERGRWLQRDEIVDMLWPHLNAESAARDFKVALNALNRALEPNRSADAPFAFIVREGTAYRLRPEADLWLDSAAFERECDLGLRLSATQPDQTIGHLQSALSLYHGDYLPDALYEDWSSEERERLLALYLRAADKLGTLLIESERYNEGLEISQAILARDACWENAYRLMMMAYARQGNRPQAMRTYQRCVDVLLDELGVVPSSATTTLHDRLFDL